MNCHRKGRYDGVPLMSSPLRSQVGETERGWAAGSGGGAGVGGSGVCKMDTESQFGKMKVLEMNTGDGCPAM